MRRRRSADPGPQGDPRALRFVTVVTYGRTGSTALQSALNCLPGVLVRGENYSALRGLRSYVQAVAETADRHRGRKPTSPWFGAGDLDPAVVVDDLRRHVVDSLLRPAPDTTWVGFKEVRYEPGHFADYDDLLDYLLFLNLLLPGIVYVVNVRQPQAAARSGWWPGNSNALEVLATTRAWLAQACEDITSTLGAGRAVLVDYDDWDGHPEQLIDAFDQLGLPRNDDGVRQAVATRLEHGPHA